MREARRELRHGALMRAQGESDDEDEGRTSGGDGVEGDAGWVDEEVIRAAEPRRSTESARRKRKVVVVEAEGRRRGSLDRSRRRPPRRGSRGAEDEPVSDDASSQGMAPVVGGWSWWGPLKRWRLQDRTTY